jgi:predicted TIM-barrel fold metal-dependent hydrolase
MIVDVHTHFFDITKHCEQQVSDDMRRCGIDPEQWHFGMEDHFRATAEADYVVVFGLRGRATGWNIPNEYVAEHVARAPDRMILFAAIDPAEPGYMDELEKMHLQYGAKGVKISPIYQGVHPHDERYYEIYRYCSRHRLPILTHMATTYSSGTPLEWARPALMDKIAIEFPDLNIILAHLGHPWEGETIALIRKQPNLFADISALYYRPWQFYNSMRLAVEYKATGRILFGSDYPATTTGGTLLHFRNMNSVLAQSGLPPVPTEIIEEIINRDSLEMLGIEKPAGRQQPQAGAQST